MSTATAARAGIFSRVWAAYLRQLADHPLRTKMGTSGFMFLLGDSIAQFGIEGRRPFGSQPAVEDEEDSPEWNRKRTLRMLFYGTCVFGPLNHAWLGMVQRVELASRWRTLAARVALDQGVWGPFIVSMFWTGNGVMEGKSAPEVHAKWEMAFAGSYSKSLCVFGPTQIVNFTLTPPQHRLAVQQLVGLGWNTYISYMNNFNNRRLKLAAAELVVAQAAEAEALAHGEVIRSTDPRHPTPGSHEAVEAARAELERRQAKAEKIKEAQGGGPEGVATRMGY